MSRSTMRKALFSYGICVFALLAWTPCRAQFGRDGAGLGSGWPGGNGLTQPGGAVVSRDDGPAGGSTDSGAGNAAPAAAGETAAGSGSASAGTSPVLVTSARSLILAERTLLRHDITEPAVHLVGGWGEAWRYGGKLREAVSDLVYIRSVLAGVKSHFDPKKGVFKDAEIHSKVSSIYDDLGAKDGPVSVLNAARQRLWHPGARCYGPNFHKTLAGKPVNQECESGIEGTLGARESHLRYVGAVEDRLDADGKEILALINERQTACAGESSSRAQFKKCDEAAVAYRWLNRVISTPGTGLAAKADHAKKALDKPGWGLLTQKQKEKAYKLQGNSVRYGAELLKVQAAVSSLLAEDPRGAAVVTLLGQAREALISANTSWEKLEPEAANPDGSQVTDDQRSTLLAEGLGQAFTAEAKTALAWRALQDKPKGK